MHLVWYGQKLAPNPFYPKDQPFTRVDSLAYFIRHMRLHRNLTKRALSCICGVSEDYVSGVESGSRSPSLKFCLTCGALFGANPNWIKNKWVNEKTSRFSDLLRKRVGLSE